MFAMNLALMMILKTINSLNSSQRDNISYTGKFEPLPEKEDE